MDNYHLISVLSNAWREREKERKREREKERKRESSPTTISSILGEK